MNSELEAAVQSALSRDPRIPHPAEIAISAYEIGSVTLRGTVGSFPQRRAAVDDVRNIDGVLNVIDKLEVSLREPDRRPDDELRGRALERLSWDTQILADRIDVGVSHGRLTLTGEVDHEFESERAYRDISQLAGVVGVTNEIKIKTPRPADEWWRA